MAELGRLGQLQMEGRQCSRVVRREGARTFQVTNRRREREDPAGFTRRELVIPPSAFRLTGPGQVVCKSGSCGGGITAGAALEQRGDSAVQQSPLALQEVGENGL